MSEIKYPMIDRILYPTIAEYAEGRHESDKSKKPPKKWWDKMEKEVKEGNPSYSKEQVDKTIGSIWAKLSEDEKKKLREAEGKEYGKAEGAAGTEEKRRRIHELQNLIKPLQEQGLTPETSSEYQDYYEEMVGLKDELRAEGK